MSLTEHIAAQRTDHGVPHALVCVLRLTSRDGIPVLSDCI